MREKREEMGPRHWGERQAEKERHVEKDIKKEMGQRRGVREKEMGQSHM